MAQPVYQSVLLNWPEKSDLSIESYDRDRTLIYLNQALSKANQTLNVQVEFDGELPPRANFKEKKPEEPKPKGEYYPLMDKNKGINPDRLLTLCLIDKEGKREKIGAFDLKTLDGSSLKPIDFFVNEVIDKANQYLTAKKIEQGMYITKFGTILDLRQLTKHTLTLDSNGYFCADGLRVFDATEEARSNFLADSMLSYTTLCFIYDEEEQKIAAISDYNFVRKDETVLIIKKVTTGWCCLKAYFFEMKAEPFTGGLKERCLAKFNQIKKS